MSGQKENGNATPTTTKENNKQKKELPEHYIQMYSDSSVILEAILIKNTPYFLIKQDIAIKNTNDDTNTDSPTTRSYTRIADSYRNGDVILKPFEPNMYINRPYVFDSEDTVQKYIKDVLEGNVNLDTQYRKVKSIWNKYIAANDFHISICSGDTIFTYFQDKIGLTHYLFFVGNNGSGKSNNLNVFHFLAYRNMISTDITAANIYQFLGSDQEGIGTICEDEADNIDQDKGKMKIYKSGYTRGKPVFRMLDIIHHQEENRQD